jgi:hypothetical protein
MIGFAAVILPVSNRVVGISQPTFTERISKGSNCMETSPLPLASSSLPNVSSAIAFNLSRHAHSLPGVTAKTAVEGKRP